LRRNSTKNKEVYNMAKLTDKEIIERIEMAPREVQVMVAKAFIREDINNDDVQYTFNMDKSSVLVEDGEVENVYTEN
jgi:hypothetical protein